MCNPIAYIALGGVQAASSFIGARNAANAQETVQRRASLAENERLRSEQISLRQQQAQEGVARGQRLQAVDIKARRARARARIAAGGAGVAGQSVDAVINDLTMQEGRYIGSEEQRVAMQSTALDLQLEQGVIASHMNQLRINRPIDQPSFVTAGLEGVQTGLNFANAMSNITRTA